MSRDHIEFDPGSYDRAGEGVAEANAELVQKSQALLAEVSDLSVLGTNDTLGGIAQIIYGVFLEAFQETVTGLGEGYADAHERLAATAASYRAVEDGNASMGQQLGEMI